MVKYELYAGVALVLFGIANIIRTNIVCFIVIGAILASLVIKYVIEEIKKASKKE
jgi:hypothetical protein